MNRRTSTSRALHVGCLLAAGIAGATAASSPVELSGAPTDRFWSVVDSARARGGEECISLSARVTDALAKMPAAAIIEFNEELTARLAESYRWDLWAVAYVANDGASDDGFDYFRGWLLTRGRARFERAMRGSPRLKSQRQPSRFQTSRKAPGGPKNRSRRSIPD